MSLNETVASVLWLMTVFPLSHQLLNWGWSSSCFPFTSTIDSLLPLFDLSWIAVTSFTRKPISGWLPSDLSEYMSHSLVTECTLRTSSRSSFHRFVQSSGRRRCPSLLRLHGICYRSTWSSSISQTSNDVQMFLWKTCLWYDCVHFIVVCLCGTGLSGTWHTESQWDSVKLTPLGACVWTVGGAWCTWREHKLHPEIQDGGRPTVLTTAVKPRG